MRRRSARRWSFGRALALLLEGRNAGIDTGFETEIEQELKNQGAASRHGGVLIPWNGMLKRDIGTLPGDPGFSLTAVDNRRDLFQLDVAAMRAALIAGRAVRPS